MWHRKRGKKKHFTILDSVAVSNLFLAFLPSMEGFLPLLFWKVCVLLHSSFGHTNKNIFFCACQNPSSQHRQNYWISAVILILFRMPKHPNLASHFCLYYSSSKDTLTYAHTLMVNVMDSTFGLFCEFFTVKLEVLVLYRHRLPSAS